MISHLRDKIVSIITSRLFFLVVVMVVLFSLLVHRLFVLQIVRGESFLENFTLKIKREKSIPSTRGSIYDRNGVVLACDKLAYAVTMEDNYDAGSTKNMKMNDCIFEVINIIERNGDSLINDFDIILDGAGHFQFALTGRSQLRFLADIYGRSSVDELLIKEQAASAEDVVEYLCSEKKFGIGRYTKDGTGGYDFYPMEGYTNAEILKILRVRYAMSLNSYQKYIATTVASNVGDETVAEVMEKKSELQGVDIAEATIREYTDDPSLSHILGYTGKISDEELTTLNAESRALTDAVDYELNDYVGKSGIEETMERKLQGRKGKQTIFVDNLGRVTETGDKVEPVAGSDLYLTIDSKLQSVVYRILEQKIAGIVVSKIRDIKKADLPEVTNSSDIVIPIDDVYFALFDNNFIDVPHLSSEHAGPYEKQVYEEFKVRLSIVTDLVVNDLLEEHKVFSALSPEMQSYESYIVSMLQSSAYGVFDPASVDITNSDYLRWKEGKLSLTDYLRTAIAEDWIDITRIGSAERYMNSEESYESLINYIETAISDDIGFAKRVYEYMIRESMITGPEICHILCEQGKIVDTSNKLGSLDAGVISSYEFILSLIEALEITPADLALDPCSGSSVITDVSTGEVIACVSYPSYDNNRLANTIDAEYYGALTNDKSLPLYDYATQQRTTPGSTFKPVSSTAGLEEGVVGLNELINCTGVFEEVDPSPKCWIYPASTHGDLNIVGAIENSCNYYFYTVGYRLSMLNGNFESDFGVERLAHYADLYGLSEKSGIEITESEPKVSDSDSVRSAIGQSTHLYTTAGLARYVNSVANEGRCFNLSLLDRLADHNGTLLEDYETEVRNYIDISSSTWNAIHAGMKAAVKSYGAFKEFPLVTGGKTGTAQVQNRPNHALFIGFAPYEHPRIAVATRVAYGYTSSNAAEITRDIYKYYFALESEDSLLTGRAVLPDSAAIGD
ncbi:MAG: penicillin-binding protein [Lachnospiraceae bacterium]|nr:penicillin-binding protein [Lachnospiraceae bacterium]